MKNSRVNLYLISTVLVLSILPFAASVLLLDEILDGTINLSLRQEVDGYLRQYQHDLKTLRDVFPEKEVVYRQRFFDIEEGLRVVSDPDATISLLRRTYLTYYLVLFLAVIVLTLAGAVILSRKVSRSYMLLMESERLKSKRIQELSYFDEWKEIAGKLAHEIKTPLTPIEIMVGNLAKAYRKQPDSDFETTLDEAVEIVAQEVTKLREMVNHFSEFSRLPEPKLTRVDMASYFDSYIQQYGNAWPAVSIEFINTSPGGTIYADMDCLLFNQCMANLITNAIEANPEKERIGVFIELRERQGFSEIDISNEGRTIPPSEFDNIFKMYYTTKPKRENMGLGLPIVRKIMLNHGGMIDARPVRQGASFRIILPVSKT